jgi:hypothetical protein
MYPSLSRTVVGCPTKALPCPAQQAIHNPFLPLLPPLQHPLQPPTPFPGGENVRELPGEEIGVGGKLAYIYIYIYIVKRKFREAMSGMGGSPLKYS